MIITNLAARAYEGEADLARALLDIVERMPDFVRPERPRVPNPADPAEDYADKWARDSRLEKCFWDWHYAVKTDLAKLPAMLQRTTLKDDLYDLFRVDLTQDEVRQLAPQSSIPATPAPRVAPILGVSAAPKPWGSND
jgi:hypothetical protein